MLLIVCTQNIFSSPQKHFILVVCTHCSTNNEDILCGVENIFCTHN